MFKQINRRLYFLRQMLAGRDIQNFSVHGVPVTLPVGDDRVLRYKLLHGEVYEGGEAKGILAMLQPGQDVIELGGSLGFIAALIRRQIGSDARHVIVEANPRLVPICRMNATREAAANRTTIVEAAVDYSGAATVRFATPRNAHDGHVGDGKTGIDVPTTTLEALSADLPGRFALVCDIEGAELSVFRHEKRVLDRIDVVIVETHPHFFPRREIDEAELLNTLFRAGFVLAGRIDNVFWLSRAQQGN
jgi:FkbM family methyltransferase